MTHNEYANLFLENSEMPCQISFLCSGQMDNLKELYTPWTGRNRTLGNVNTLIPTRLINDEIDSFFMTNNYAFFDFYENYETVIRRYEVNKHTYDDYTEADNLVYGFIIYDENTIYTLESYYTEYDLQYFNIYKIIFQEGTIPTKELIQEYIVGDDNEPRTQNMYDGNSYYMVELKWFVRHKFEDDDCLVFCITHINNDDYVIPKHDYMFKFYIYNINKNISNEQWVDPTPGYCWGGGTSWYECNPSFYESKIIFAMTTEISSEDPTYPTEILDWKWFAVLITDIVNNTTTLVNNFTDSSWEWNHIYNELSAVDYTTGTFYFTAWLEHDEWIPMNYKAGYYLFNVNLNYGNPTIYPPGVGEQYDPITPSYEADIHMFSHGDNNIYYIERENAPGICDVYKLIPKTLITNLDIEFPRWNGKYFESCISLDLSQSMIWNMRSGTIQGKHLEGGVDRDIIVDWVGGSIPFIYPSQRFVWFIAFKEKALMYITSYLDRGGQTPDYYQREFFLLAEKGIPAQPSEPIPWDGVNATILTEGMVLMTSSIGNIYMFGCTSTIQLFESETSGQFFENIFTYSALNLTGETGPTVDEAWAAIDGEDNIHIVVGIYHTGISSRIYYNKFNTNTSTLGTWELLSTVAYYSLDRYTMISIDENNNPHVVFSAYNGVTTDIKYMNKIGGTWSSSETVNINSVNAKYPQILCHHSKCSVQYQYGEDMKYRERDNITNTWGSENSYLGEGGRSKKILAKEDGTVYYYTQSTSTYRVYENGIMCGSIDVLSSYTFGVTMVDNVRYIIYQDLSDKDVKYISNNGTGWTEPILLAEHDTQHTFYGIEYQYYHENQGLNKINYCYKVGTIYVWFRTITI